MKMENSKAWKPTRMMPDTRAREKKAKGSDAEEDNQYIDRWERNERRLSGIGTLGLAHSVPSSSLPTGK